MARNLAIVLYVLLMIAVIVGLDIIFFKNRFWERLIANVAIVLMFGAIYFAVLKRL